MTQIPLDNLGYPVFIQIGDEFGTGFILETENNSYFISAKHVFFNHFGNLKNNTAKLKFRVKKTEKEEDYLIDIFEVNLIKLQEEGRLITHSTKDLIILDLFTIKLNKTTGVRDQIHLVKQIEPTKGGMTRIKKESICPIDEVEISNDIFIFGYPNSIGIVTDDQFDYDAPLIRKGIVSQVYKKHGTLILDCMVHGGNSGGPVIQMTPVETGGIRLRLIGVLIQFVPYYTKIKLNSSLYYGSGNSVIVDTKNSGYSVAVSIEFVVEIINEYEERENILPQ